MKKPAKKLRASKKKLRSKNLQIQGPGWVLLLMKSESGEHQLRLVVFTHYLQGFIYIPGYVPIQVIQAVTFLFPSWRSRWQTFEGVT